MISRLFPRKPPADHLIWSMYHNAWWRPDSCGYTVYISAAGRYTEAEARRICAGSPDRNRPVHLREVEGQVRAELGLLESQTANLRAQLREIRRAA